MSTVFVVMEKDGLAGERSFVDVAHSLDAAKHIVADMVGKRNLYGVRSFPYATVGEWGQYAGMKVWRAVLLLNAKETDTRYLISERVVR